jgi:PKD repeat protein
MNKITISIILFLTIIGGSAYGATIYVDGSNTIQEGIDSASDGDTVIVFDGLYVGNGNKNISFNGKAITLKSMSGPTNCIIDCEGSAPDRLFEFVNGETNSSVVDGFTIRNGNAPGGGGIYCSDSSPTIVNNIITGNHGEFHGGGIACFNSSARIIRNVIIGNAADRMDGYGGGILSESSSLTIYGNVIANNTVATGLGSGIFASNSNLVINKNTIAGNRRTEAVLPDLSNEIQCVSSTLTITNTILWFDSDCLYEIFVVGPNNHITTGPCVIRNGMAGIHVVGDLTMVDGNIINSNPLFVPDEAVNFHLQPLSPCINAGDPAGTDIGAYEDTIYVNVANTGFEDGTSLHPYNTIQEGINSTRFDPISRDTVLVADGLYRGAGNVNLNYNGKDITVKSVNGAQNCVIDCENTPDTCGFIFGMEESNLAVVDGFTIRNGNNTSGAGIYCDTSEPTIINNIITGSGFGSAGSGINCSFASPIIDSNIIENTEENGIIGWLSSSTITNNIIRGHFGSGINLVDSSANIANNTITSNMGAGISCTGVGGTISGNIIRHNTGRGIRGSNVNLTIDGNVITDNWIIGDLGNAMYFESPGVTSNVIINQTTIANNIDLSNTGYEIYLVNTHLTMTNTILWTPLSIGGSEIYSANMETPDNIIDISYSDIRDAPPDAPLIGGPSAPILILANNIDSDPLFMDPTNGDYHLRGNSMCLNRGTPLGTDIGAYQYVNAPPVARIDAPATGLEGSTITLDAGSSTDPNFNILQYRWDLNGDGNWETGWQDSPIMNHIWGDDWTGNIRLEVTDGEFTSTAQTTITISNVSPILSALSNQEVTESNPTINLDIPFTDPGFLDTHSATIGWGDGITDNLNSLSSSIVASHTYPKDNGSYEVSITLRDDDGGQATGSFTVTITNVNPIIPILNDQTIDEGQNFNFSTTFTDGGTLDTHIATINWGDGSPVVDAVISESNGSGTISGSHIYADNGIYTVLITLTDKDDGQDAKSFTMTVNNVIPEVGTLVIPVTNEGQETNINISFTDAGINDTHLATIDWGDGTLPTQGIVTESNGSGTVSGAHIYKDNGTYNIQIMIEDDDGGQVITTGAFSVNNMPPIINAGIDQETDEGQTVVINSSFSDFGLLDTHTGMIDWGDGSPQTTGMVQESNGSGTIIASHIYKDNGIYEVTVSVTDKDGAQAKDNVIITVNNKVPIVDIGINQIGYEGQVATFSARFTDDGVLDTHRARIGWGDGSPSTDGVINESNGSGTVTGDHVYKDNGTYKVTVTVTDKDGGIGKSTYDLLINNKNAEITAFIDQSGYEGQKVLINAKFTDAGVLDTHKATIDCGDGSPTIDGIIQESNGSGTISGDYIYKDNGIYKVTLKITDKDNGQTIGTANITVNNVIPEIESGVEQTVEEGRSFDFSIGFTDAGILDTHKATIDWGDGTPSIQGSIIESNGSGKITGNHIYVENNSYIVTIIITDKDGGIGKGTATINVKNAIPIVDVQFNQVIYEGQLVSISASFTDAGILDTHKGEVDFGDGTSTIGGIINESNGSGSITVNHIYKDNGIYKAIFTIIDDDGGQGEDAIDIQVNNKPPSVDTGVDQTANEGQKITINVRFTDDGVIDTHKALINWDDGSPSTDGVINESNGSGIVTGDHVYKDNGIYKVTVIVIDKDDGQGKTSFSITINNTAPMVDAGSDQTTEEGQKVIINAQFSDNRELDTHKAIIDWGDSSPNSDGIVGSGVITSDHIYKDNGVYIATVIVTDKDGAQAKDTIIINVTNKAPETDPFVDQTIDEGQVFTFNTKFTDDGINDTHKAIIDWGDGFQSLDGTIIESDGSGVITGDHIYKDNGIYKVIVTLTDKDGGELTNEFNVKVINKPPEVVTGVDQTIDEGQSAFIDASFKDDGVLDTHKAIIDWGDGDSSDGVIKESDGSGTFTGNHIYKDNGIYEIVAIVTDKDGGQAKYTLKINVNNKPPTIDASADQKADEGEKVAINASFSDVGVLDTHKALIDWGDKTSLDDAVITESDGSGILAGSHIYIDNGIYAVKILVIDKDGGQCEGTLTVTVNNKAPIIDTIADQTTDEGLPITIDAKFTDTGILDTHKAIADWGDGTEPLEIVIEEKDGSGIITCNHVYKDNGLYKVTLTVIDKDGDQANGTFNIKVNNVVPKLDAMINQKSDEGQNIVINASFTDVGVLDTHKASIDWGDGTLSDGIITESNGSGTINANHVYNNNGEYQATLTIIDKDDSEAKGTFNVTISNKAPIVDAGSDQTVDEGQKVVISAKFTDDSVLDTHKAFIDWGDGTFSDGIVTESKVTGDHIYGNNGNYIVKVSVIDNDGGQSEDILSVVVSNQAPEIAKVSDLTVNEGQNIVINAKFTDAGILGTHRATIDWGDNSPVVEGIVQESNGSGTVTGNHVYINNGIYKAIVKVIDKDEKQGESIINVNVNNSPPVLSDVVVEQSVVKTRIVALKAKFVDAGKLDTHKATVDWGDGIGLFDAILTESNGVGAIAANHEYKDNKAYTVTVKINDNDGGSDSATASLSPEDISRIPAITVSSISRNTGTSLGGTEITIIGENFGSDAKVTIGGKDAEIKSISDREIILITPNGQPGMVDIVITNSFGQKIILQREFNYIGPAVRLTLLPITATLKKGEKLEFTVSGSDSAGNQLEIKDSDIDWSVTDVGIGGIGANGLFSALGFGKTKVKAILKSNTSIFAESSVEIPDTESPKVLTQQLFPESENADVPVTTTIQIQFSEPINTNTINDNTITIMGKDNRKISGKFEFDPSSEILSFTPDEPFKSEESITVIISANVEDLSGNKLSEFKDEFTTGIRVWPGDTNNDGTVDILDIIPLGQYWNKTGQSRAKLSSDWSIQPATQWKPDKLATYADANGDGKVDENDIIPIAVNWNLIHELDSMPCPKTSDMDNMSYEPSFLNMYESIYQVLDNMTYETKGSYELKKAVKEIIDNIKQSQTPKGTKLFQNYPNPFNPETWIPYNLKNAGHVVIRIYNALGQQVRTLDIGLKEAGVYTSQDKAAYWDGKNDKGEKVSNGIYFYNITFGNFSATRKMVILE